MVINKLLDIVLVAEHYIVVKDNDQNRRINIPDASRYNIGDRYEVPVDYVYDITEVPEYGDEDFSVP